jgi:PelA/Pel-15E family pectate lyase
MHRAAWLISGVVCWIAAAAVPAPGGEFSRADAAAALRRATDFFRGQCGLEGGYVWRHSADLTKREGEQATTATQVWTQPPSTATVGEAFLEMHLLTGEEAFLAAARETAECLIRGQLRSGGWDKFIELDPAARRKIAYRVDPPADQVEPPFDTTTLDDDKTQCGIRFLMRLDAATDFGDPRLHEAARYALDGLVTAQRPNGGWPQRFTGPGDPARYPVRSASYPESWSRSWPGVDFIDHYTFNDGNISGVIGVLLEAAATYAEPRYRAAAEKAGDFIRLAQMPEPQPAWAQQYDADMHPAWARKFEPPAVTGGESQGIIRALLALYRATGEPRFLEPVPPALAWMRRSRLPDGSLARFYELRTNRPLYFTKDMVLTYEDGDLRSGYCFEVGYRAEELEAAYRAAREATVPAAVRPWRPRREPWTADLAAAAARAAAALDDRGAWVEDGRLGTYGADDGTRRVIRTGTFVRNALVLARAASAE